jgi:hypothetical protein
MSPNIVKVVKSREFYVSSEKLFLLLLLLLFYCLFVCLFVCLFACFFVFCSCFCIMYFHQCLPAIYLSPYVVLLHNVITYMYTVLCL